jgi:hypothetical protein
VTSNTNDPGLQILAGLAGVIKRDYPEPAIDIWAGSPFKWILSKPPASKGAIGRRLVEGWCTAKGFNVRGASRGASRVIEGKRVAIKFSLLWEDGDYAFEQIRNQNYDFVFCLGVSPSEAHGWLIPKAVVLANTPGQHTGAAGRDTAWIQPFNPGSPPDWMAAYGGGLEEVTPLLQALR